MDVPYEKPLPIIPDYERPFWEATKKRELRLQRCADCGHIRYPSSPICPECWSSEYEWARLSGRGKVISWIVYHRAFTPAFAGDVPYNVAWIELEEGPRLVANIIKVKNEEIHTDMAVQEAFIDITDELTLLQFQPAT
ncbi:MAG: Zn-ribbon domain-containing OB-fold protein [Pseudomonadota bacterium]